MNLLTAIRMPTWNELDACTGEPKSLAAAYAYARIGWRKRRAFRCETERLLGCGQHEPVVYFMRVGKHVKIGTTTNLRKRMLAFYLGPEDVLAVVPGDRCLEGAYHWRFHDAHIEGNRAEVFRMDRELRLFLARRRIEAGDVVNGYFAAVAVLLAAVWWLHSAALLAALLTYACVLAVQFLRLGWHHATFPPVREVVREAIAELRVARG